MNKKLALIFAMLAALFIYSGTAHSFTKSNVIAAIKKDFAEGGNMMAIKVVLLNVFDVQTGIMQKKSQYNPYDRTTRIFQELPYEAKVKVNCVRRNNNKIIKTVTDDISGTLSRNKMGRFEITGVNPSYLCDDYNIGCVSGDCENGLGVELFYAGEGNDEHRVLFMGTYKNGKKQCGFETPLTSGWLEITGSIYADKFRTITEYYHYEEGLECGEGDDLVERLLNVKYITKDDYKQYHEISEEKRGEED